MKLKEWMEFNEPLLYCDFRVKLYEGEGSNATCLVDCIVSDYACKTVFGEYEIERVKISQDGNGCSCLALILNVEDSNADDLNV